MTPRPKDGSPWIVPPREARGKYVSTENGPAPIKDFVRNALLRPDQINEVPRKRMPTV